MYPNVRMYKSKIGNELPGTGREYRQVGRRPYREFLPGIARSVGIKPRNAGFLCV